MTPNHSVRDRSATSLSALKTLESWLSHHLGRGPVPASGNLEEAAVLAVHEARVEMGRLGASNSIYLNDRVSSLLSNSRRAARALGAGGSAAKSALEAAAQDLKVVLERLGNLSVRTVRAPARQEDDEGEKG